jgi:sugar/nucleoside kinase (ribokinase family)
LTTRSSHQAPRAVFAGLCTFDIIQSVTHIPDVNEKTVASRQVVAAGGPAVNAAVTFAYLGGQASLVTAVGAHPLSGGILADLQMAKVGLIDADPDNSGPPAVSSIMVVNGSGQRAVVSVNATGQSVEPPAQLDVVISNAQVVLIDGHHPELALASARAAHKQQRLCILDGGSWKNNTPDLLPLVDVAICSADFHPPGIAAPRETLDFLLNSGVAWAAITNGADPIVWAGSGTCSTIPVPSVKVTDTCGAGDIFHGAFAYAIAQTGIVRQANFVAASESATRIATYSCQYFGTRAWMREAAMSEL